MGKNNSKHQKQVDGENIPQTNGTEGGNTVVKQKPKKANKKLTPQELEELENCTYCKFFILISGRFLIFDYFSYQKRTSEMVQRFRS